MKLALIGVGQAGGKVLDEFLRYDRETGSEVVRSAVAVNTAATDLRGLERVPDSKRVLIGQSRVKGHGVGADNELAATIAQDGAEEIQGALDVPASEIDAFLVVGALGGGTGSGAGPVIIKHLQRIYTEPVYGLGILPARDEGSVYTLNAARSLQTFVREADNLLLFDNDAWRETGESVQEGFAEINEELVRRFGVLFSAGEITGDGVAESVVDASEIVNTLAGGGISTVGYATEAVETDDGLLSQFDREEEFGEGTDTTRLITSLVRKATLGRLTLPCELSGIERALVIVSGPPEYLGRRGIERSRKWLEDETGSMEVRGGDYPLPGEDKVAAAVLLSGASDVPRIDALQRAAVDAQDAMEETREESEDALDDLLDDDIDPLL